MEEVKHPAVYSPTVLREFLRLLKLEAIRKKKTVGKLRLLDPLAGTGKIHQLPCLTRGIELEPEWAQMHANTDMGDARHLPYRANSFDLIGVSPCYGNRMADHHDAKDGSTRRSYTHDLGRKLSGGNAGAVYFWNEEYLTLHRAIWAEAVRVLRPEGAFLLNSSDFYRTVNHKRELIRVTEWHVAALFELGLRLEGAVVVDTPGMRFGDNRGRVRGEMVVVLRKSER